MTVENPAGRIIEGSSVEDFEKLLRERTFPIHLYRRDDARNNGAGAN